MRVVYLHQYFRTPNENGGVRSFHIARSLAERGHEVHIITAHTPEAGGLPRRRRRDLDGIIVHSLPVAYDNSMSIRQRAMAFASFAARSSVVARRLDADVVVASSTPLTVAIPGVLATWRRRGSLVFEVRDLWPGVPIAMGALRSAPVRWAARRLESFAYDRATRVIALSDDMARGVARVRKRAGGIHVIPNFADIHAFAPDRSHAERWLSQHPGLRGRPLAIYAGTFGRVNDLGWLVGVARQLRTIGSEVVLVAVGQGAEKEAIRSQAYAEGVLGRELVLLEPVAKRELPDLLAASTVVLSLVADNPALWGNSANKFFDALAAGRPIAMNYGGWQADVLARTGAGTRVAREPRKAAEDLTRFVADGRSLIEASASARRLARERYSLEALTSQFCDIVESVRPDTSS